MKLTVIISGRERDFVIAVPILLPMGVIEVSAPREKNPMPIMTKKCADQKAQKQIRLYRRDAEAQQHDYNEYRQNRNGGFTNLFENQVVVIGDFCVCNNVLLLSSPVNLSGMCGCPSLSVG